MRTVTIPSNSNPWVCNINGVVYSYEAGTEQSVPDEVASLIDNINADQPVSGHPGNDGDVLTMTESGEPVWAAGGGGGGMMVVTITGTEEDGYNADKTAKEIYEAMPNVICKIAAGDGFEFCNPYSCSKGQADGIEFYSTTFNNVIASDQDDDGNITIVDSTTAKIESVAGNEIVQVIYGEKEF